MKLGDICSAPCFDNAAGFQIPPPGCSKEQLCFNRKDGRQYFSVLLTNHALEALPKSPRVAIVGLSPAGNQIQEFAEAYAATRSYAEASIRGAFAGLAADIIAMFDGLGLSEKLGLQFSSKVTLARHPEIYVTSLIACASLDADGGSDDFKPGDCEGATRCATIRFVNEMLSSHFSRLKTVVVLGTEAERAVKTLQTASGETIEETLKAAGKTVLFLPHPSGQNREYVQLASFAVGAFPGQGQYVDAKWKEYRDKPPRPGRKKEPESRYKAKRSAYWRSIYELRRKIAGMEILP